MIQETAYDTALALIGLSGRFPGARGVEAFWRNIAGGVKSIRRFSDEELLAAGIEPALLQRPNYVKAGTVIEDIDRFDATFFGFTPREAEIMDPQHRLFLECAWEALESAAYDPERYQGLIGVFAGSAISMYLLDHVYPNPEVINRVGRLQASIGNDRDSLASTVSYKLNLKGPSFAVQTFCSTSLVAVHLACQSLLNYECDIALAGGVAIALPQVSGYLYEEGGILSPDGECRTFDARGRGSVMGNGLGVVTLKRFQEAVDDGDYIYAVVLGSALNNDGSQRVSYTAPGLDGQTGVIAEALGHSGVDVESIGYIEAHGTATELGDAVELAAMIKAFGAKTRKKQFCAIGSVKPNVGHLDRAAGVTGLIKTALALHHKQLPPSLNFESASPDIDLANSPFYVNIALRDWPRREDGAPRRAGVSSFGLGGTNVHMTLEEAPQREPSAPSRPWQLLPLSAKTATALETMTANLAAYLKTHEAVLSDVAYTLQVGRGIFAHRRAVLCRDRDEAIAALESADPQRVFTLHDPYRDRPVVFLFPGSGAWSIEVIQELSAQETVFREAMNRCRNFLKRRFDLNLDDMLQEQPVQSAGALFAVEYALAQLLISWGIRPSAMQGVGLGERVAACLSGVLSLEDALTQVADRDQLVEEQSLESLHETLAAEAPDSLLLEIGSGLLRALNKQHLIDERVSLPALSVGADRRSGQEFLLETLGRLWLAGVTIDWAGFYANERPSRLPLPAYPFERQRYWIEAKKLAAQNAHETSTTPAVSNAAIGIEGELPRIPDITDWFFLPSWKLTLPPDRFAPDDFWSREHCWLVFRDEQPVGSRVIDALRQHGQQVIAVTPGTGFAKNGEGSYTVQPDRRSDYENLLKDLRSQGKTPTHVAHLWTVSVPGVASLDETLNRGFHSLIALAQALGDLGLEHTCDITIISNEMQQVSDSDQLCPAKAAVIGPCRVIPQEYANLRCRSIDIVPCESVGQAERVLIAQIMEELASEPRDVIVALRNGQRWAQIFEPVALRSEGRHTPRLREGGVYLITGGLGGIGLAMAQYLARSVQARLVLISRSGLPPRSEWPRILEARGDEQGVGRQVRIVQEMEAAGTEILALAADVTNEAQMRAVVQQTLTRFGRVDGVLHTAGVPGIGLMQLKTPEQAGRVLAPKVQGTLVLERVLQNVPVDFLALFSSMTSTTGGGPGQVDYCAANAFLDAYARQHAAEHGLTVAIDWGEWQWNAWEEGLTGYDAAAQTFFRAHRQEFGISFEEGAEALGRILAYDLPLVVVSTQDFRAVAEVSKQFTAAAMLQRTRESHQSQEMHPRPALGSSYTAPGNELEQQIAAVWEDLLGIAPVGMEDNFFELGGNSLTGIDLMARLRKTLQAETLAAHILYEAPTVSALARYVERGHAAVAVEEWQDRSERRRAGVRQRVREAERVW
jgi:acyl transferase domain-containing protein